MTHSSHRLDCQCHSGYYRLGSDTAFQCPICTENDYCFNNSRYNCSDTRMVSEIGSDAHFDCVCVPGLYNNGSVCETCPAQHFCPGDKFFYACAQNEWTNNQLGLHVCICQPGYWRNNGVCTPCLQNSYCPGTADEIIQCPGNTTSPSYSSVITDCACIPGYTNTTTESHNHTMHECNLCQHDFVKTETGNHACVPCYKCLPINGQYEIQACRPAHDAVCDQCDACLDPLRYTSTQCMSTSDAICSLCHLCDFSKEYEALSCEPQHDRICHNITFDRACENGQFAGRHTNTSDSKCTACQYRDTNYFNQRLHYANSAGQIYNDKYSCQVKCLGFSILRDPANHSLGCKTCEDGNLLLRTLKKDPDDLQCLFDCRPGYKLDESRNECVLESLASSTVNTFTPKLAVSNFERTDEGFVFTVLHANHSRFVVTVGPHEPYTCSQMECCWSNLWRVSTLNQLGAIADGCESKPEITRRQISGDTLQFAIPDVRIGEVANCSFDKLDHVCTLVIAITDTILKKTFSQSVILTTKRSTQYAWITGKDRMIPLQSFDVKLMKAYSDTDSDVFVILVSASSVGPPYTMTTRGVGMTIVQNPRTCSRLNLPVNVSASVQVDTSTVSSVTYWRVAKHTSTLRFLFSLQGADAFDLMDIAAVRNVSGAEPICFDESAPLQYSQGYVEAVAGLGQDAVENSRTTGITTHGESGTLLTFMAFARGTHVTSVKPNVALAAHVKVTVFIFSKDRDSPLRQH